MVTRPWQGRVQATRLAHLLCLVGLLGLVGCVPEDAGFTMDPMVGGTPMPRDKASTPPGVAGGRVPDPPEPGGPVSPAGLASQGAEPPADPQPTLRISGTQVSTTQDASWQKQNPPTPAPAVSGDPLTGMDNPAPIPATVPVQAPTKTITNIRPLTPPPAGPPRIDTYQQAQDQLASRGVVSQELRQIGENGMWEFKCSVPNPQNASLSTVYEVRAPGENGVAAIRLVLQKIDADRHP